MADQFQKQSPLQPQFVGNIGKAVLNQFVKYTMGFSLTRCRVGPVTKKTTTTSKHSKPTKKTKQSSKPPKVVAVSTATTKVHSNNVTSSNSNSDSSDDDDDISVRRPRSLHKKRQRKRPPIQVRKLTPVPSIRTDSELNRLEKDLFTSDEDDDNEGHDQNKEDELSLRKSTNDNDHTSKTIQKREGGNVSSKAKAAAITSNNIRLQTASSSQPQSTPPIPSFNLPTCYKLSSDEDDDNLLMLKSYKPIFQKQKQMSSCNIISKASNNTNDDPVEESMKTKGKPNHKTAVKTASPNRPTTSSFSDKKIKTSTASKVKRKVPTSIRKKLSAATKDESLKQLSPIQEEVVVVNEGDETETDDEDKNDFAIPFDYNSDNNGKNMTGESSNNDNIDRISSEGKSNADAVESDAQDVPIEKQNNDCSTSTNSAKDEHPLDNDDNNLRAPRPNETNPPSRCAPKTPPQPLLSTRSNASASATMATSSKQDDSLITTTRINIQTEDRTEFSSGVSRTTKSVTNDKATMKRAKKKESKKKTGQKSSSFDSKSNPPSSKETQKGTNKSNSKDVDEQFLFSTIDRLYLASDKDDVSVKAFNVALAKEIGKKLDKRTKQKVRARLTALVNGTIHPIITTDAAVAATAGCAIIESASSVQQARAKIESPSIVVGGVGGGGGGVIGEEDRATSKNGKHKQDDFNFEDPEDKENTFKFTQVLLRYLEQTNPTMYQQGKDVIKDCAERRKRNDSGYECLPLSMNKHLKILVGDEIWNKTKVYLTNLLQQEGKQCQDGTKALSDIADTSLHKRADDDACIGIATDPPRTNVNEEKNEKSKSTTADKSSVAGQGNPSNIQCCDDKAAVLDLDATRVAKTNAAEDSSTSEQQYSQNTSVAFEEMLLSASPRSKENPSRENASANPKDDNRAKQAKPPDTSRQQSHTEEEHSQVRARDGTISKEKTNAAASDRPPKSSVSNEKKVGGRGRKKKSTSGAQNAKSDVNKKEGGNMANVKKKSIRTWQLVDEPPKIRRKRKRPRNDGNSGPNRENAAGTNNSSNPSKKPEPAKAKPKKRMQTKEINIEASTDTTLVSNGDTVCIPINDDMSKSSGDNPLEVPAKTNTKRSGQKKTAAAIDPLQDNAAADDPETISQAIVRPRKRAKKKGSCALCTTCPCQKSQNSSNDVSSLDMKAFARSDAAVEKVLIRRVQKLEKSSESIEEQADLVRRKLKMHRREVERKKRKKQELKKGQKEPFLPDPVEFEAYHGESSILPKNVVLEAQKRIYPNAKGTSVIS